MLAESGAWKSAVHLKAVCQGDIPVVTYRCIGTRSVAKQCNQAPAILYRESSCLMRQIFQTRDFSSAHRYAVDSLKGP
jgi:hypothetical protein